MATNEIHLNDVGTNLDITIKDGSNTVDVNGSTVTLFLTKPDGVKLTKTTSPIDTGSDGQVRYTTASGDLDVAGIWRLQVTSASGSTLWYSDISSFKVFPNL